MLFALCLSACAVAWTGAVEDQFGTGISVIPDSDGDGWPEVLVCDHSLGLGRGRVWVLSGRDLGYMRYATFKVRTPGFDRIGDVGEERAAASLARIGSGELGVTYDADGVQELVMVVWDLSGLDLDALAADEQLRPEAPRLCVLDDQDGDGVADYVVSIMYNLENGDRSVLRTALFSGKSGHGVWMHETFGRGVDGMEVSPLQRDGRDAAVLVAGALYPDDGGAPPPLVALSLDSGRELYAVDVWRRGMVEGLGDMNGDGWSEFAVGGMGPYFSEAMSVYSGQDGTLMASVQASALEANPQDDVITMGSDIEKFVDTDGDGVTDFLVSTKEFGAGTPGEVLLLSGRTLEVLARVKREELVEQHLSAAEGGLPRSRLDRTGRIKRLASDLRRTGGRDVVLRQRLALELERAGRLDEALRQYLWCFDTRSVQGGEIDGRLWSLLRAMTRLGRRYPPAAAVLRDRLEALETVVAEGSATPLAVKFCALAHHLGEQRRALDLYDRIAREGGFDAARAPATGTQASGQAILREMLPYVVDELVREGRYDEILAVAGDVEAVVAAGLEAYLELEAHAKTIARQVAELCPPSVAMGPGLVEAHRIGALARWLGRWQALAGSGESGSACRVADLLLPFCRTSPCYALLLERAQDAGNEAVVQYILARATRDLAVEDVTVLRSLVEEGK